MALALRSACTLACVLALAACGGGGTDAASRLAQGLKPTARAWSASISGDLQRGDRYESATGLLSLPALPVLDGASRQCFDVQLGTLSTDPVRLELATATERACDTAVPGRGFDAATGVLKLPALPLVQSAGTTCYDVALRLINATPIRLELTSAAESPCAGAPVALGNFRGNVVLGSPTGTSIKANVFSPDQSGTVWISWGTAPGQYTRQTPPMPLRAAQPLEIPLEGLAENTRYHYRLQYQPDSGPGAGPTEEASFHTARAPGSSFTFALQGDSHPERAKTQFDPELYTRTLLTAAADQPDFYLTIGDDFSVDTLDPKTITAAKVTERYTLQRPYLGLIGRSAPVYLVNGNHEQAARYLLDGTPDNVAVWAQNARNAHYSQPAPDHFYSGNAELVPHIGLLRNHYAWHWGDALFVVIDPYWASPDAVDAPFGGGPKRSNLWSVTHGDAQYQWLKTTLQWSQAKYKFVFAHHVMGTGRGGIELADAWEWGGQNARGAWGFDVERPTWSLPIHQLMAANHVTIFFQGHDHIWVRQAKDGVVYQTLSEPADPNYSLFNSDAFLSGDKLPNTGYTRVTVAPAGVKVDYVRTWLPKDEGPGRASGSTAFSYTIAR